MRGEEHGGCGVSYTDLPLTGTPGTGSFNLVGHTRMQTIPWADVRIIDGGIERTLQAFDGFWVKAYKAGLTLRIPMAPTSSPDALDGLDQHDLA